MANTHRRTLHEAPVNVDLPVDLVDELHAYLDRTGAKKKNVIELALRRFIAAEAKPVRGR